MKYFVYYNDGPYELDGVGFESFDSKELALAFVRERLQHAEKPNVDHYTLIEGFEKKLEPFERVLDVRVK